MALAKKVFPAPGVPVTKIFGSFMIDELSVSVHKTFESSFRSSSQKPSSKYINKNIIYRNTIVGMVNKLKICRCCLSEKDKLHEFSLEMSLDDPAADAVNFIKIGECYSTLTRIFVHKREENYSKVCIDCLDDLKSSYLFQRKCLDNDKSFNRLAEGDDDEEIEEGEKLSVLPGFHVTGC